MKLAHPFMLFLNDLGLKSSDVIWAEFKRPVELLVLGTYVSLALTVQKGKPSS